MRPWISVFLTGLKIWIKYLYSSWGYVRFRYLRDVMISRIFWLLILLYNILLSEVRFFLVILFYKISVIYILNLYTGIYPKMFIFYSLFDESIKIIKIVKLGLCKSIYFFELKPYLFSVTIIENILKIYVFVSNLVLFHYIITQILKLLLITIYCLS